MPPAKVSSVDHGHSQVQTAERIAVDDEEDIPGRATARSVVLYVTRVPGRDGVGRHT